MKYCLSLLFFLNALTLSATTEKISICYAGIDPAEVLFYLYLSTPPGGTRSPQDIIDGLSVDFDAVDLDTFRLELARRIEIKDNEKRYAHITTLWGNHLDVTFNISEQVITLEDPGPRDITELKSALVTLKHNNKGPQSTYQQRAEQLYDDWISPFSYTWKTLQSWYDKEPIPSYETVRNNFAIIFRLDGIYSDFSQQKALERVTFVLSNESLMALINTSEAQTLYRKGDKYNKLATQLATTPAREAATRAGSLAQSAAIHRFVFRQPSITTEKKLNEAKEALRVAQRQEEYIYQIYLNQNKTGGTPISFSLEGAVR